MLTETIDIFHVGRLGVRWLESASSIEEARMRVQNFGNKLCGDYIVLNQVTGDRLAIKIDSASGISGR